MDLLFSAGNEIIIVTLGTESKIEPMPGALQPRTRRLQVEPAH